MTYIFLILAILYFEYGVRVVEKEPITVIDEYGHDIDIEDDLSQYRSLVLTTILIAGLHSVIYDFYRFFTAK